MAGTARLISYGGWIVPTNLLDARVPWDSWRDVLRNSVNVRNRTGQSPSLGSGGIGERRTTISFSPVDGLGGAPLDQYVDELLAGLDLTDIRPKLLVLERPDGIQVQRLAIVENPFGAPADPSRNAVVTTFVSADPIWRQVTPDAEVSVIVNQSTTTDLAVTNTGPATVSPVITIDLSGLIFPGDGTAFLTRFQFSVTNNSDETFTRRPIQIKLGNTADWVTSFHANASGTNVHVYLNGKEIRRKLINFNQLLSYMWMVVDHLSPGGVATYDILIGDQLGTNALTLVGKNSPVFDTEWSFKSGAAGGTSTTFVVSGSTGWDTDQWKDAYVEVLSGTGAGQKRIITANVGGNPVTISSAWTSGIPDATSTYLLYFSDNSRWVYNVRQIERTYGPRGLYWIDTGQSKPEDFSYDSPGSWYPYLFLDNNDEKNQSLVGFPVTIGTTDYYSGLDADRTWEGGSNLKDEGEADGLAFNSPLPINTWTFDGQFKNPNAMAKAFYGARLSASTEWGLAREILTANTALTAFAALQVTLPANTRQLVAALLPVDESLIPTDWARQTGNWTGGGLSSIQDDSKDWASGQWTNATVRLIAGIGAGASRTVASSGTNTLNVTPNWPVQPDDTTKYEVINKKLVATLRSGDRWVMTFNTTNQIVTDAVLASPSEAFVIKGTIDSYATTGGGLPRDRIRIGVDKRILVLTSLEALIIDCDGRRAAIHDALSGDRKRDVTDMIRVETLDDQDPAAVARLATRWMPLPFGLSTIKAANQNTFSWRLAVTITPGWLS